MSVLSDIFFAGVLQFVIPTILVFYVLNSDDDDCAWWKVNPGIDRISTGGMYLFFIGLAFVISATVFDLPVVWRGAKGSLGTYLIVTLVGLIVFIIGKYIARKKG
jgi:hypothetical protein